MGTTSWRASSGAGQGLAAANRAAAATRAVPIHQAGVGAAVLNAFRQVGGSLSEILDMVSDTVRGRVQFARKVKALTAMGRASAYVLVGMPFALAAMIFLVDRAYMLDLTAPEMTVLIGGLRARGTAGSAQSPGTGP